MADQYTLMAQAQAEPYEALIAQAQQAAQEQRNRLNKENDRALQQAYVSRRIAERDLPQRLSAYGINGGLTETSAVDLQNNYGRQRSAQELAYTNALADLDLETNRQIGDYRAQIAAAKAQAEAQRIEAAAAAAAKAASRSSGGGSSSSTSAGLSPLSTAKTSASSNPFLAPMALSPYNPNGVMSGIDIDENNPAVFQYRLQQRYGLK